MSACCWLLGAGALALTLTVAMAAADAQEDREAPLPDDDEDAPMGDVCGHPWLRHYTPSDLAHDARTVVPDVLSAPTRR